MRTSLLFASTLAALLTAPAAARAQYLVEPGPQGGFATPPPRRPTPRLAVASSEKPGLLGVTAEGGAFYSPELPTGAYGRLGVMGLTGPDVHGSGPVFGIWEGLEGWGTRGIGGGSLAVTGVVGWKTPGFLACLNGGFNLLAIDKKSSEDRRYAIGLFTPRAGLRVGFQIDSVFVGFTGDVQRRYAWGRGGATLFQGGLAVGALFDPVEKPRPRPAAVVADPFPGEP